MSTTRSTYPHDLDMLSAVDNIVVVIDVVLGRCDIDVRDEGEFLSGTLSFNNSSSGAPAVGTLEDERQKRARLTTIMGDYR